MSRYALVIAGCLSGERGDAGVAALVDELAAAVGADTVARARTGGRPVGAALPEVLGDLRGRGVRRALVVTTHVADGRLQREAAGAAHAAAPGPASRHARSAPAAPTTAVAATVRLTSWLRKSTAAP